MFGENGFAMLVDEGGKVNQPNKQSCFSHTALQLVMESNMDKLLLPLESQRRVQLMSGSKSRCPEDTLAYLPLTRLVPNTRSLTD